MNQKIIIRICCIALVGWFLWAMQLLCSAEKTEDSVRQKSTLQDGLLSPMEVMSSKSGRVTDKAESLPVVVLDAGHGGMDPGKIGVNGALEKDINLAIALKLKALLEQNDISVVMTRSDENGLYKENDKNKKSADMRERIRLLSQANPVVAVSIHQNSFTDSRSRGAQVFYYGASEEGKRGAELIQETVKRELADGNHRVAKANTSYYMLKKSSCPLVIVECGFLSNPEEAQLLATEQYQRKMAWAVHLGILEWLNVLQTEGNGQEQAD